jgi:predicted nucleic acid-binding protein
VVEPRHPRGLVDTSVVIDLDHIPVSALPHTIAISAVTLAELATGPHTARDAAERARRQDRLERVEATYEAIPFDVNTARACGRVFAVVAAAGRKARGRRALDLFIASTALAEGIPLFTQNPADFDGLSDLIEVVPVEAAT